MNSRTTRDKQILPTASHPHGRCGAVLPPVRALWVSGQWGRGHRTLFRFTQERTEAPANHAPRPRVCARVCACVCRCSRLGLPARGRGPSTAHTAPTLADGAGDEPEPRGNEHPLGTVRAPGRCPGTLLLEVSSRVQGRENGRLVVFTAALFTRQKPNRRQHTCPEASGA